MTSLKNDVESIIYKEWDPIGVYEMGAAEEEYGAYVPHLLYLIRNRVSADEIESYLRTIQDNIGLSDRDLGTSLISRRLVSLIDS